jgi:hypothetical protein
MHESDDEQRARLAYEASLRALDQQRRSLEEIRSRTGVLLAAASVSASFLGSKALDHHASLVLTYAALALFVIAFLLGIFTLVLDEGIAFTLSGSLLHARLAGIDDRAGQYRYVADWLMTIWTHNDSTIRRLDLRIRCMAGTLAIQMVLWTISLGATVR